jgi:hypothetical protein
MASTISAGTSAGTAIAIAGDTSGSLELKTNNGTTAVTVDTAQNVTLANTKITLGTTALGAGDATTIKNRIINGDFYIAQRATSATLTAGSTIAAGYATVDRFYGYCTGANVTMAQVAGTGNNRNLLQFTGAASVTAIGCGQRIETLNSYDLAGSTVTLSAFIANSLLTSVTWTAYYANTTNTFGTLASPTRTQIATGTFTVTSTLTQYNAQISIPSAATTGIEIVFTVGAQTSGTWQLDRVQLELGSSASSYEYRQFGTELQLCQRYYESTAFPDVSFGITSCRGSAVIGGGGAACGFNFLVPKRTNSPTVTLYSRSGNAGKVSNNATGGDLAGTSSASAIGGTGFLTISMGTALAAGDCVEVGWTSSAEL